MNTPSVPSAPRAPRSRRRPASGLVLAGVLTGALAAGLAGCGIAPTDVIDAGEPATGVKSPGQPESDVQLFFYGPSGLRSATRPAKAPADPNQAIQLLLAGPNHAERMRGLSSVLPAFPGALRAEARNGGVEIELPMNVKLLDSASLNQLVCTAANARVPGNKPPDRVPVTLAGDSVRIGPMVCGGNNAFPVVEPTPSVSQPSDPAPSGTATPGGTAQPAS
ncbi:hypothetical protein ACFXN2_01315 [Streptomyces kronopolitis]|uniref:hypothetical protein n=1 Tax=Streptomyces kronopolitis TaxID=1612435 RepID=UPI0020BF1769|nr:hypothetical protein [Streptomyces kronopolitis]MCL6301541.1 hypothetical protein [Streptomyces kronopolitis]